MSTNTTTNLNLKRNIFILLAAAVMAIGCRPGASPDTPTSASATGAEGAAHGHAHGSRAEHRHDGSEHDAHHHGEGPHGGTLADWGGGKYHVEFTVDHDEQKATVYVLGTDEKTLVPITTSDGMLLLTIDDPEFQVELRAEPFDSEAEGTSSRYVGRHDDLGIVREFSGSIVGEIDGTPYAGDFEEKPHANHDHN